MPIYQIFGLVCGKCWLSQKRGGKGHLCPDQSYFSQEIDQIFVLKISPIFFSPRNRTNLSGFLTKNFIRPVYCSRKSSVCTRCHTSVMPLLCRSTYKPFLAQLSWRFKSTMLVCHNALIMQSVQIGAKFQCLNCAMPMTTLKRIKTMKMILTLDDAEDDEDPRSDLV